MANTTGKKFGGRTKGTPNKKTQEAREAISLFVEGNVERLEGWLDEIAAEDPKAAFDRFMSVVEYHIPKLARVESEQRFTDKNGNDLLAKEDLEILKTLGLTKESKE